jgi:hypothetical protein
MKAAILSVHQNRAGRPAGAFITAPGGLSARRETAMTVYSGLSNGELLGQLRALAEEGRTRLAAYVARAKSEDEALHQGLVFVEKLESALNPRADAWSTVYWLKDELQEIAAERPDEAPPGAWGEFLSAHPELVDAFEDEEPPAARLDVDAVGDDAIVAAVKTAIRQRQKRWPNITDADARDVAMVLSHGNAADHEVRVHQGDVIRVGLRLGRLARSGRLVVANKPYERHRSYVVAGGEH